jgi:hypothetical protein
VTGLIGGLCAHRAWRELVDVRYREVIMRPDVVLLTLLGLCRPALIGWLDYDTRLMTRITDRCSRPARRLSTI